MMRTEYRRLFRELSDALVVGGWSVDVRYRGATAKVHGQCDFGEQRIVLKWRKGLSLVDKLFIFAHEFRHAFHHERGIRDAQYAAYLLGGVERDKIEIDCDTFALQFLNDRGVDINEVSDDLLHEESV